MSRFDLSNYETVQQRLDIFWKQFPEGRIETVLVEYTETRYIIQALGYKTADDTNPFATGYAEETVGSTPVNKTSAIENCETSALGRMLRNGGIGKNASREEMEKVERVNTNLAEDAKTVAQTAEGITDIAALRDLFKTTSAALKATEWSWEDEGGFKVNGTIGEYIISRSKKVANND